MKYLHKLTYVLIIVICICGCKKESPNLSGSGTDKNGQQQPFAPQLTYNYEGNGQTYVGQAIFDSVFHASDILLSFSSLKPDSVINFYWNQTGFVSRTADQNGKINLLSSDFGKASISEGDTLWLKQGGHKSTKMVTFKRFQIRSWQDLQAMRITLNGNYSLINDITFPDPGTGGFVKTGFDPIGTPVNNNSFSGSFAGNRHNINHFNCTGRLLSQNNGDALISIGLFGWVYNLNNRKISGFTINQRVTDSVKMGNIDFGTVIPHISMGTIIGKLSGGIIDSVSVINGTVCSTNPYSVACGGLIGEVPQTYTGTVTIQNSSTSCKVVANAAAKAGGADGIGGLIGFIGNSANSITNCSATGNVEGSGYGQIGGLIGVFTGANLNNCYATGDVSGTTTLMGAFGVGGLIGSATCDFVHNSVTNCHTSGNIKSNIQGTGGLIGVCPTGILKSCYTTGSVVSTNTGTGGLVGTTLLFDALGNPDGDGTLATYTSYSTGNITGVDYVGGICGYYLYTVNTSFSSGNITGRNYVGGICSGTFGGTAGLTDCFVSGDIIGEHYVGGIEATVTPGLSVTNCFYSGKSITGTEPYVDYLGYYVHQSGVSYTQGFYVNNSAAINTVANAGTLYSTVNILNFTQSPGAGIQTVDPFKGFDFANTWKFNSGKWPTLKNMPK